MTVFHGAVGSETTDKTAHIVNKLQGGTEVAVLQSQITDTAAYYPAKKTILDHSRRLRHTVNAADGMILSVKSTLIEVSGTEGIPRSQKIGIILIQGIVIRKQIRVHRDIIHQLGAGPVGGHGDVGGYAYSVVNECRKPV